MKVRQGHVSNSSSSSFIIIASGLSVKELAMAMLDHQLEYKKTGKFYDNDYNYRAQIVARIEREKRVLTHLPENQGVSFPSINYDTFIHLDGKGAILVDTCNNEGWEDVFDFLGIDWGYSDNYKNTREELFPNVSFVHLVSEIRGRPLTYDEIIKITGNEYAYRIKCPNKCVSEPWVGRDTDLILCGVCGHKVWETSYTEAMK